MPNEFYFIHLLTNVISGLCFFAVAIFINKFINRVVENTEMHYESKAHPVWIAISKYRILFIVMSFVFFFCGLGHIVGGTVPYTRLFELYELVNVATSTLGVFYVWLLFRMFYGKNN